MQKRIIVICLLFISIVSLWLTGCGQASEEQGIDYKIYYVNQDGAGVSYYTYHTVQTDSSVVLQELILQMQTLPEKLEYRPPLCGNFTLLDYQISSGQLTLNFSNHYKEQDIITEILARAAIVRTLIQTPDIQHIVFHVNGEPLTDAAGNVVGVMNNDSFIDNTGNEINTYEKGRLQLYFADEEGRSLISVSRNIVYSSNIPIERQLVEEIIAGPKEKDALSAGAVSAYPVINPDTKIISVNVRDGVCYVNLDDGFMNQIYNVSPEVCIYAIANSLVELSNVNKVQISVNGETNINYRESIILSTVFERNLDLVKTDVS